MPELEPPSPVRRSILIVDDDLTIIETFSRYLTLEGFRVLKALDVDTGLRHVDSNQPNAVILDLRMPLRDGLQFLRAFRAKDGHAHTPVAIVTGDYFLDDMIAHEIRSLGALLRFKPLWLEDLVALARQLLKG